MDSNEWDLISCNNSGDAVAAPPAVGNSRVPLQPSASNPSKNSGSSLGMQECEACPGKEEKEIELDGNVEEVQEAEELLSSADLAPTPLPQNVLRLNVLVVGDIGSGKSSLINTLLAPLDHYPRKRSMPMTGVLDLSCFSRLDIKEYSACAARPAEEGGGALDYTFIEVQGGLGTRVMSGIVSFLEGCHSAHFSNDQWPQRSQPLCELPSDLPHLCLLALPHAGSRSQSRDREQKLSAELVKTVCSLAKWLPVIPVLTKADLYTVKELDDHRTTLREQLGLVGPAMYCMPNASVFTGLLTGLEVCTLPVATISSSYYPLKNESFWPKRTCALGTIEVLVGPNTDVLALRGLLASSTQVLWSHSNLRYAMYRQARMAAASRKFLNTARQVRPDPVICPAQAGSFALSGTIAPATTCILKPLGPFVTPADQQAQQNLREKADIMRKVAGGADLRPPLVQPHTQRLNLLVIGDVGEGKSSFIRSLLSPLKLNEDEDFKYIATSTPERFVQAMKYRAVAYRPASKCQSKLVYEITEIWGGLQGDAVQDVADVVVGEFEAYYKEDSSMHRMLPSDALGDTRPNACIVVMPPTGVLNDYTEAVRQLAWKLPVIPVISVADHCPPFKLKAQMEAVMAELGTGPAFYRNPYTNENLSLLRGMGLAAGLSEGLPPAIIIGNPSTSAQADVRALRRLLSSAAPILKAETERRYHAFRCQKLTGKPLVPDAQSYPNKSWAHRIRRHIRENLLLVRFSLLLLTYFGSVVALIGVYYMVRAFCEQHGYDSAQSALFWFAVLITFVWIVFGVQLLDDYQRESRSIRNNEEERRYYY